jgi:hypothetical protein
MTVPFGGRVRDARKLEKVGNHTTVARGLMANVTGDNIILVIRTGLVVTVFRRLSMTETMLYS